MVKVNKSLVVVFAAFVMLIASVFASPIDVSDVNIQEDNGEYMVLVTLDNANVASGVYEELSFTIEELGISKTVGVITVDTNESMVFTYNLRALTDSYDLLKKGNTYSLTAYTPTSEMTESFLFGTEKTTEGLDLIMESVKVNGQEVDNGDTLQVMNGETLDVDMRFTALANFDNARIMVFVEGYEHSTIVDSTPIFAVVDGKTYVKSISINLPSDMDSEKDYKLRITGASDLSGITYSDYTLYVDTQRHRVDIVDLVMTPTSGVEAGQNIIANVRLKNRGQKAQDSVKVIVAVPQLGVQESSYVSNVDPQDVVSSDDMLLFVPENAAAGQYEVLVTLSYDDGYTLSTDKFALNILAPKVVAEENLIVSFNDGIDLVANEASEFEIVIANPNSESKPISIAASDNVWADVEVTPSLAMVKGGESESFKIKVTPKNSISGEKELKLYVKEGTTIIDEITVKTYVEADEGINWINVALAVLLIIAIIILLSLIITIAKRRNDEGEEEYSSSEEYY